MTDKIEVTQADVARKMRWQQRLLTESIGERELLDEEFAAHRIAGERAGMERAVEWQPIETAPKDGTWLMCWGPDCLHGIAKFYPNPIWAEYPEYTYWQTLSAPPAIRAQAGEAS